MSSAIITKVIFMLCVTAVIMTIVNINGAHYIEQLIIAIGECEKRL